VKTAALAVRRRSLGPQTAGAWLPFCGPAVTAVSFENSAPADEAAYLVQFFGVIEVTGSDLRLATEPPHAEGQAEKLGRHGLGFSDREVPLRAVNVAT
jgi:hypothetical protein